MTDASEIEKEYLSSLGDLNVNSKPLINMLTILAEENIEHGQVIVDAIEKHITKIAPDAKLPVLYLIDSIVKNVGGQYLTLFSHSIVNIFLGVFKEVNEKIRQKMFALRQTWNDVFPIAKLYALDVKTNVVDPGWPVTAKVTPAIHVNPNFFKSKSQPPDEEMQTQLRDKQRELLELQKRKLELELAATMKHIAEQEKQLQVKAANVVPANSTIVQPETQTNSQPGIAEPLNGNFGKSQYQSVDMIQPKIDPSVHKPHIEPTVPAAAASSARIRDPRIARMQLQNSNQHNFNPRNRPSPVGPTSQRFGPPSSSFVPNTIENSLANRPMSGFESVNIEDSTRQSRNSKNRSSSKEIKSRSTSKTLPKSAQKPPVNQSKSMSTKSSSSTSSKVSSKSSKTPSKTSSPTNRSSSKDPRKDRYKEKDSNKTSPSRSSTTVAPVEVEKKKKEYTIPFKKRSPSPKDKIVKSITDPKVSSTTKTPISPNKLKGIKTNSKPRNYTRRNRDDESSPISNKDITQPTPPSPPSTTTRSDSIVSPVPPLIEPIANLSTAVSSAPFAGVADSQNFKNNVIETPSKDVDLRVMLPNTNTGSSPISTTSFGSSISVTPTSIEARKRSSEERILDEPSLKKRKAEKIDALFGKEDVDLRTQITQAITPIYPNNVPQAMSSSDEKPDWATIKADTPKSNKSNLDAVRAKLAEASRHLPNKSHRSKDIDLRRRHMREYIEDSQDGNDATFKMILARAQAQLDNDDMNLEQYNNLMQQVVQAHTKSKKESLKRKNDSINRVKSENNDEFSSSSCDSNAPKSSNRHGKKDRRTDNNSQDRERDITSSDYRSKRLHKDKRNRNSKWTTPAWEQNSTHMFGYSQQQPNASIQFNSALPNPWQNNPQIFPSNIAAGSNVIGMMDQQYNIPAQQSKPNMSSAANERTINIDSIPREIRFYDETAIAFMSNNGGEPKEIGFQAGERRVLVDNKDSIVLAFNDSYKSFNIDGITYQIRFGSPIRELYINNVWYECFFGDPPVNILLDGKMRQFKIEGPSPQVRIGNLRTDLVVGKIDLYIDVTAKVSLYLDAQVQQFELDNQMHTVQFADYFLTVLIDKEAFVVEYGGMPKKIKFGGRDHYIRFSVMPDGVVPGMVYIKNMLRTERHRGMQSPPPITYADINQPPATIPVNNMLTSTATTSQVLPSSSQTTDVTIAPVVAPSININDLFEKLLASGILNNATNSESKDKSKEKPKPISLSKPDSLKYRQQTHIDVLFSGMQCSSCGVRFPPEQTIKYSQHLDWHFRQNRRDRDSARRAHSRRWYYDVADWIQYEEIEDLDEREKNWFETQQSEMDLANDDSTQRNESPVPSCIAGPDDVDKTCDMCHDQFETFYNEDNEEWHLRNALRVDNKTYHPICFEDHKSSMTLDDSDIKGDLDDENAVDVSMKKESNDVEVEGIILDDDDDVIVLPQEEPLITEIPDDDDAPTSTVSSSNVVETTDSMHRPSTSGTVTSSTNESNATYESIGNESDLQILVPQISVVDVDDFEEKPIDSTTDVDESLQNSIKIKEEPKDDGYEEDDGFEDIGTFEEATIIEDNSVDGCLPMSSTSTQPQQTTASTHQTQASMITSLDGNVQLLDIPTSLGINKIKINITKNVTKNVINVNANIDKQTELPSEKGNATASKEDKEEEEITFDYKATMKDINFKKLPAVRNGEETSGLCTIM